MSRRQAVAGLLVAVVVSIGLAIAIRPGAIPQAPAASVPPVDGLLVSQLVALGYASEVSEAPAPERRGVVSHDARASRGVNVHCSVHRDTVRFLDMDGSELHCLALPDAGEGADCMLEPYDETSFLALTSPRLGRLDWDSRVLGSRMDGYHRDVAVDGTAHPCLDRDAGLPEAPRTRASLRDHVLERLGPDGVPQDSLRLSTLFGGTIPAARLDRMASIAAREGVASAARVRGGTSSR